jgi:hypothetical protein
MIPNVFDNLQRFGKATLNYDIAPVGNIDSYYEILLYEFS